MTPSRCTLAPPMLQTNKLWPGGTPGVLSSPGEGINPGLPRITQAATQAVITKFSIGRLPSPAWTQAAGFLCRCFPDTRLGSRRTSVTFTPQTLCHLVGGDLLLQGGQPAVVAGRGRAEGGASRNRGPGRAGPADKASQGPGSPRLPGVASHQPERQSWGLGLWVKGPGASAWLTDSPHPPPAWYPGPVPEPGSYRLSMETSACQSQPHTHSSSRTF